MVGRSRHMEFKVYGVYNKTVATLWKIPSYHSLQTLTVPVGVISILFHHPLVYRSILPVYSLAKSIVFRIRNVFAGCCFHMEPQLRQQIF